ncbi:DNA replication and repair protein RadC [Pedobacter psychrotolerans]|uniref:DNA repair protein RadC n=1 Tax=Pedobacter psychrotolerans TaxID=1843235 RepID=A0A4R2HM10_9SPHI|nr:DNA repair protein RadC [Pedobacter psychrotolerans]TCO30943.1 DNA replication and repair protein RadC [Pedobacter psychrotolerans]GGE43384.1 DNA repair protein RadC [Pedobacter psychrotolerans]
MENYDQKLGIKLWAEEDRPREKLLHHGRRHLTDAELIAILIGSGSRNETAVDLSKRILSFYENNLAKIGQASIQDLSRFKGIGEAKAITIIAALELGLRRKEIQEEQIVQVTASSDVHRYLYNTFADLNHEEFWILLLNRSNHIIGRHLISKGGQAGTVADPKIIFKVALERNAANIVLAHNHPSGNLKPSESDNKLTRDLVASGMMLGLYVVDHLIFARSNYYSYKDEDLI